ncbi:hypothetical protein BOX37_19300 [Nocardia mangyaensis]|uniref:Uncharacterized protein n=1 Tax=Nocardia mangyaensis TaxID=2213200 RepID=A0A1J0VUQ6_9NOCA|nr:hypothetical protein [Nocardia mangyaensis]APE35737.1 hypothetical protein BOX37_19300 [Nocardia mangyaensis]
MSRASGTKPCAAGDRDFEYKVRKRKSSSTDEYVCTQLNAKVGDCFNNPRHVNAHLDRLRKVPCGTGAYEVDTRLAADDIKVCDESAKKFRDTEEVRFVVPPVSYCLHKIGA